MCTLTIVPTKDGYLAAMNRDELRSRPIALRDLSIVAGNGGYVTPREASGGTWIACSSRGNLFALLNWNLQGLHTASTVSRGTVIHGMIAAPDASSFKRELTKLPLESLAPFRLVGAFLESSTILEGRWNGTRAEFLTLPWARGHWFSSSVSDELAAVERGATCERAAIQWPAGTSWLRRLHRSHAPAAGAFSVCVHRTDAATVSYTEVHATESRAVMSYLAGNPCQEEKFESQVSWPITRRRQLALAS